MGCLLPLALVLALVAACGSTATPAPSGSQAPAVGLLASAAPSGAAPSTAPAPTPSADPEALRQAAAAAYLKAANIANKADAAISKKYKVFRTVADARAYCKAEAKIEGAFIAAIKKIEMPPDTKGDVHTLISRDAALQALLLEGAASKTWSDVASVQTATKKAARLSTAAANLVRVDLGLPPVKF